MQVSALSAKHQSTNASWEHYYVNLCHLSNLGRLCTSTNYSWVELSQNGGQLLPYEGVIALHTGLCLLPRKANWILYQAVKFGCCSVYDSVS